MGFTAHIMVEQRTRSSRTKVKSIKLTDIKSDSTCLTIHLPRDLCCDICQGKKSHPVVCQKSPGSTVPYGTESLKSFVG